MTTKEMKLRLKVVVRRLKECAAELDVSYTSCPQCSERHYNDWDGYRAHQSLLAAVTKIETAAGLISSKHRGGHDG